MIQYCKRCCLPSTKPHLSFDEEGICNACRNYENRKNVDWDERKKELMEILDRYRSKDGSNWDCIIPVSGGKDSTYQVITMLELGMNPLCVTATTCDLTDIGRRNIENIKKMGVDYIEVTTNRVVRAKLNRIGLTEVGDISWPEHVSIFTVPVRMAVNFNVPLIIWGENSQNEYGGPAAAVENNVLDRRWLEEFGGMLGTMVKVYELTGKENHLKAAKLFENEKLFYPMEEECDTLEDMHANQHIPQIIGAMDLYRATGDEIYWEIGKNFWNIVTGGHTYCIGGVGETEMFHRANTTCSYLTDKAAESCASYNMLRLTSQLFEYTRSGNLMDYYDNTLRNHILTSSSHKCDGGTTYFLPLGPGGRKEFFLSENSCCHGTGMESRFRYMENIYAQDEDALYINLLVDSVLTDENGKTMIELQSVDEEGVMEIRCQKDQKKVLKIHIPAWGQKDFNVSVNGKVLADTALHDGYLVIDADPKAGDVIRLELPMEFRVLDNKSDAAFVNLAYGPYILAALSEEKEFLTAPAVEEIHMVDGKLQFEANGMKMIPLPEVDMEAYHVYFHKE